MEPTRELDRRDFLKFIGSSSLLIAAGLIEFPNSVEGSSREQYVPRLAGVIATLRDRLGPASSFADWTAGTSFTTNIELNANPRVYIALPSKAPIQGVGDLVKGAVVEQIVADTQMRFVGQELPKGKYFLWIGTIDSRNLPNGELEAASAGIPLRDEVRRDGLLVVAALIDADGQICIVDPWLHHRVRHIVEGEDSRGGWMDEQLFELSPIALLTKCPPEQKPVGSTSLYSLGSHHGGGSCPAADKASVPALSPFGLGILGSALMYVVYRFLKVRSDDRPDETA